MIRCLTQLWKDESGFILSAELVMISTILVLGMIVGLTSLQSSVVGELTDVSDSIRSLNQSYFFKGFSGRSTWGCCGIKSRTFGSAFIDRHSGNVTTNEEIVGNCYMTTPVPETKAVPATPKAVPCPEGVPCDQGPAISPPCSTCEPLPEGTKLEPMPETRPMPAPGPEVTPVNPKKKLPLPESESTPMKERKPPKKVVPEVNE